MSPQRIQRRRTKGWRMPDGAVYVGRGTRWGNEYVVRPQHVSGPFNVYSQRQGSHPSRAVFIEEADTVEEARRMAACQFRVWLEYQTPNYRDGWLRPLRGKDLACWCPEGQPCHADILIALANPPGERQGP